VAPHWGGQAVRAHVDVRSIRPAGDLVPQPGCNRLRAPKPKTQSKETARRRVQFFNSRQSLEPQVLKFDCNAGSGSWKMGSRDELGPPLLATDNTPVNTTRRCRRGKSTFKAAGLFGEARNVAGRGTRCCCLQGARDRSTDARNGKTLAERIFAASRQAVAGCRGAMFSKAQASVGLTVKRGGLAGIVP